MSGIDSTRPGPEVATMGLKTMQRLFERAGLWIEIPQGVASRLGWLARILACTFLGHSRVRTERGCARCGMALLPKIEKEETVVMGRPYTSSLLAYGRMGFRDKFLAPDPFSRDALSQAERAYLSAGITMTLPEEPNIRRRLLWEMRS